LNENPTLPAVPESASGKRFTLVDALRGIAALSVLLHHLFVNSELQKTLWLAFPHWFIEFCLDGAFGVQIFFVLSGFVIAHSLRNVRATPRAVGNFILRRQLRLDPPYWTILALTIGAMFLEAHIPWIEQRQLPTWTDVVTNFLYLQKVTGTFPIMAVSWTLCLEVQFYLVFIVLLLAGKLLSRSDAKAATLSASLVAGLAIVSLLMRGHTFDAWFIRSWYYFAAGVLCYWAVNNPRFRSAFIGFLIFYFAAAVWQEPKSMLTGWSTALLLYTAGRMGKLSGWLDFAPLQYLGRISYSLYLSHLLIAVYVLRAGYRLTHTNQLAGVLWFVVAGAVSIGAAHVMYLLIERPSIRFGARFKLAEDKRPAAPPAVVGTAGFGEIEELQNA